MKNFIYGILFSAFMYPVVEGFLNVINQSVEYFCTKIAVKTYKLKQEIEGSQPQETHVVGFQISKNTEDEEE